LSSFPTAPAWYRPLLSAERSILRLLLPRLRSTDSAEHDPLSHRQSHPELDHGVSERLVPQVERGADRHMPHHVGRYAWALRACEGRRVVDLGCGAGYGTVILSSFAGSVIGVDASREAVEAASRLYPSVEYRAVNVQADPLPEAEIGVCFEVLEHLDDPEGTLTRFFEAYPRLLLSLPNPLAGGSHINPHHLVDWPLATLKRKLREAGAAELTVFRQGYFSPAIRRWRPSPSVTWVIDASRRPRPFAGASA
jgi:SAM-dependent methyltransferase